MDKPILLTKRELKNNRANLNENRSHSTKKSCGKDKINLEGLLVVAVASFEHSLKDNLKVLLTHIPENLDLKTGAITKVELIERCSPVKSK